ncbi:MAG TPA: exonuclease [Opitutae bacterium]|nr:exonuclease [Opitutae bacterium]|tara:strand:+ start:1182 stop:1847 length:666 start_codon:yes stop_codon:yes gene_type:complete
MFVQKKFTHIESKFTFNDLSSETTEEGRYYLGENNKKLPSVTTVTGWAKKQFFAKWRAKNPKEAKRVTRRGNKLHSVIEDYLNNKKLVLSEIPPLECDLFLQLKPELDKIDNIVALEVPLYSSKIGLAGRVDCVGEYDGELCVIDFKGSTRDKEKKHIENYMLQATAYCLLWEDMTGEKIDKFKILVSCETGSTQVFGGSPSKWVKPLVEATKYFWKEHIG